MIGAMKTLVILWVALIGCGVAGCGGAIGGSDDTGGDDAQIDASTGPDADPDAPDADPTSPDADPATNSCPPGQQQVVVYVNNEGEVIRGGFESAINNTSTIITGQIDTTPVTTAEADAVVAFLEDIFAFADPIIVTTRPAPTTPPSYVMVVLHADDSSEIPNGGGFAPIQGDCSAHVGIAFAEKGGMSLGKKAAQGVGLLMGLQFTTDSCMDYGNATLPCTFHEAATIDASNAVCGGTSQDEVMLLTTALGCR